MATLLLDDLHGVIDDLGASIGFAKGTEDYGVCVVDEATFKVYNISEIYASHEPGQKLLTLVINTTEKHPEDDA